jgi:UDP-glucose 4-epimerase
LCTGCLNLFDKEVWSAELKSLVTGGAGFIGSNLAEKLCGLGDEVVIVDNFSSGFKKNIEKLGIEVLEADIRDKEIINSKIFKNTDRIFHLAANVDNRFSWDDPELPVRSNIEGTLNVCLAARNYDVNQIVYSSTGTVYGDLPAPPYREDRQTSGQTTLYGATKYSAEGILSVFATHYAISSTVFRFVGVLGPKTSHGHLFDFMSKLAKNPKELKVLGNGYQKKAYVDVDDVITALINTKKNEFDVFNIGRPDFSTVRDSVRWMCEEMDIDPQISYENTDRGWIGDNPTLYLNVEKILNTGWQPTYTIENSVKRTVRWLSENKWILRN